MDRCLKTSLQILIFDKCWLISNFSANTNLLGSIPKLLASFFRLFSENLLSLRSHKILFSLFLKFSSMIEKFLN